MVSAECVRTAYEVVKGRLPPTPLLTSSTLDDMSGCKILFKSEHLQKTGSFKARGALYNIKELKEAGSSGVITHSSGNHGQAVAWAARASGLPCTVVVPRGAPVTKVNAIVGYGADVHRCGNAITDREEDCARLAKERKLDIIEPFSAPRTIAGQGTIGEELKEQTGQIEALFVSVGGGGLAAGIALSLPNTHLYLVEPEGKHLAKQLDGSHDGDRSALPTVADGIRVRVIGDTNREVLNGHAHKTIITVSEEEISEALILIWTRLKQHVEPTAAVAYAGLRQLVASHSSSHSPLPFSSAVVVLCGGNVDHSYAP